MRRLLLLLNLLLPAPLLSQTAPCSYHDAVDISAKYQYGPVSLINYVTSDITPLVLGCMGPDFSKTGNLYAILSIDSTGVVREVSFSKNGLSDACRTKLQSRIMAMKGWTPALKGGVPVCSRYRWPIGTLGASVRGMDVLQGVDTLANMKAPPPAAAVEQPRDTIIHLQLFDLRPYDSVLLRTTKKKLLAKALKQTLGESRDLFLKYDCLRWDAGTKAAVAADGKAPDCRLDDFHFFDLDRDGDLDIVYSSLVDQFLNWDGNRVLIFRNNGGNYSLSSLPGYLHDADFSRWKEGLLVFKTVERPCCGKKVFAFHQTGIHIPAWQMVTSEGLKVEEGQVREMFE